MTPADAMIYNIKRYFVEVKYLPDGPIFTIEKKYIKYANGEDLMSGNIKYADLCTVIQESKTKKNVFLKRNKPEKPKN